MVQVDILGDFALVIGQIIALVTLGTLIIQSGRWLTRRRMPRDYYFFFLSVIAIIAMGLVTIYNFNVQNDKINVLETKQLQLQNTTVANQQLLLQIHKKLATATVVNTTDGKPLIVDTGH